MKSLRKILGLFVCVFALLVLTGCQKLADKVANEVNLRNIDNADKLFGEFSLVRELDVEGGTLYITWEISDNSLIKINDATGENGEIKVNVYNATVLKYAPERTPFKLIANYVWKSKNQKRSLSGVKTFDCKIDVEPRTVSFATIQEGKISPKELFKVKGEVVATVYENGENNFFIHNKEEKKTVFVYRANQKPVIGSEISIIGKRGVHNQLPQIVSGIVTEEKVGEPTGDYNFFKDAQKMTPKELSELSEFQKDLYGKPIILRGLLFGAINSAEQKDSIGIVLDPETFRSVAITKYASQKKAFEANLKNLQKRIEGLQKFEIYEIPVVIYSYISGCGFLVTTVDNKAKVGENEFKLPNHDFPKKFKEQGLPSTWTDEKKADYFVGSLKRILTKQYPLYVTVDKLNVKNILSKFLNTAKLALESSKVEIISNEGIVNMPEKLEAVDLKIKVTVGEKTSESEVTLKVLKPKVMKINEINNAYDSAKKLDTQTWVLTKAVVVAKGYKHAVIADETGRISLITSTNVKIGDKYEIQGIVEMQSVVYDNVFSLSFSDNAKLTPITDEIKPLETLVDTTKLDEALNFKDKHKENTFKVFKDYRGGLINLEGFVVKEYYFNKTKTKINDIAIEKGNIRLTVAFEKLEVEGEGDNLKPKLEGLRKGAVLTNTEFAYCRDFYYNSRLNLAPNVPAIHVTYIKK